MYFGNRIPFEFFCTKGKGESDMFSPNLFYETGSFDEALIDAKIENTNIITYSSILPKDAKQIPIEKAHKQFGEVVECILARADGHNGERISASIMVSEIRNKNKEKIGSLVTEYSGFEDKNTIIQNQLLTIKEMCYNRGYGVIHNPVFGKKNMTDEFFSVHIGKIFIFQDLFIRKSKGTVVATICFVSYKYPLLSVPRQRTLHTQMRNGRRSTKKYKKQLQK
jgi:arginine decarboxylase